MTNLDETYYRREYDVMSDFQLKREFHRIRRIPNARTNIEALTRMSALLQVMEEKDVEVPKPKPIANASSNYQSGAHASSGPNGGAIALGLVIFIVGLAATMVTDRIWYGAMIVGVVMAFRGMISD